MRFTRIDDNCKGWQVMALPIKGGKITTKFAVPGTHWKTGRHEGVDFAVPDGTDVLAVADGVVTGVGSPWGKAYGSHSIVIHHGKHGYMIYAHNQKALVKVGDKVKKGQHIAESGHDGNVTGPHLHVELQHGPGWKRGGGLDPEALFKA